MDEQRSRGARALAERALVRLLHELHDDHIRLIVLGGLVPEILAAEDDSAPEHLGTTDVDILLITQVDPATNLGAVERALERIAFEPDTTSDGWRWRGPVDGATVKMEFLCDLPNHREGEIIQPSGCARLAAANLRGPGYVAHDFSPHPLTAQLGDGRPVTVNAHFAGIEGYLLSKCVALRARAATKDYYDLVYVLMHNSAGGPEQAANRLREGGLADALPSLQTTFVEVRARYMRTIDSGPVGYAEQALEVEPSADIAQLRADAVDVVQRFFAALEISS
ncbi:MAG: hypothetical protein ACRDK4_11515 [Solirubrobacteraceae bacterium]